MKTASQKMKVQQISRISSMSNIFQTVYSIQYIMHVNGLQAYHHTSWFYG